MKKEGLTPLGEHRMNKEATDNWRVFLQFVAPVYCGKCQRL